MFYLPTKEEADELVEKVDCFYRMEHEVEGCRVHVYNYRLATYVDFKHRGSIEMRGLTFVEWDDGTWKRFLALHKFFNVNETEGYLLHQLENKPIDSINTKHDGSMINFVKFPNGKIRAKSKMSFDTDQAIMAQVLFEQDKKMYDAVDNWLDMGCSPIYEYVSPKNRIVLSYNESSLKFLQLRDQFTGMYALREDEFNQRGFNKMIRLKTIVEDVRKMEGIEGYVITFGDGQKAKVKTEWYCDRHRLLTEDLNKENFIIRKYLNEEIDDIISLLDIDDSIREWIGEICDLVNEYIKKMTIVLQEDQYKRDQWSKKDYVLNVRHEKKLFALRMRMYDENPFDILKEYILKNTFRLEQARKFLKEECDYEVYK